MPSGPDVPPAEAQQQIELYLQGHTAEVPWRAFGKERPITLDGTLFLRLQCCWVLLALCPWVEDCTSSGVPGSVVIAVPAIGGMTSIMVITNGTDATCIGMLTGPAVSCRACVGTGDCQGVSQGYIMQLKAAFLSNGLH